MRYDGGWITMDAWYAMRAREMDASRQTPPPSADVALESTEPPGFLAQWGPHLAVLAVGLGLAGVLLRGFVFPHH